ncbi:MAG: hypothetical protein COA70_04695 [Planctomycetota bacterium]|nr:MAG: hypothetical protein COA70_04695 [Planctomycetota bacterium]
MKPSKENLHLYEECLLLALKDEEGTKDPYVNLPISLGGALLADLLLLGKVEVEKVKKQSFLKLVDPSETGDPLLDECTLKLHDAKRRATLGTWVQRFGALRNLKHRAAEQLVARGILKAQEDTVLLIFKRKIYPELDGRVEKEIVARLKKAIFTRVSEIDPRTVVLVSLADKTGLLRATFDKKKLKEQKKRIEQIAKGELIGAATQDAINAAMAAVLAASMVPILVTTTITS